MIAKRCVLKLWMSDLAPKFETWLRELMSILHVERLRYELSGNPLKFYRIWSPVLEHMNDQWYSLYPPTLLMYLLGKMDSCTVEQVTLPLLLPFYFKCVCHCWFLFVIFLLLFKNKMLKKKTPHWNKPQTAEETKRANLVMFWVTRVIASWPKCRYHPIQEASFMDMV